MATVGVVASLVFAVIAIRGVEFGLFWRGLKEMQYVWVGPSLVALAVTVALRIYRWQLLFTRESRPPFGSATRALLIGSMLNQILPLRAGEAARVVVLNQDAGISRVEALGTVVVERVYDVLVLFILLFVAWPVLPPVSWIHGAAIFAVIFVAGLAAAVAVLVRFGSRPLRFVLAPVAAFPGLTRARMDAAAESLTAGLRGMHHPKLLMAAFAVSVISWLTAGLSYWAILVGFHLHLSFAAAVLVLVATNLALVIPSLPAGLGVFEAAAILALGAYGLTESQALACAVVLHAVNLFPYIAVGLGALHRHALLRRRRLRARGSTAPD